MVWDPGGIDAMYRLEGKPIFKKEGMLGNVSTKPMPTHFAKEKTTKEQRSLRKGHELFQKHRPPSFIFQKPPLLLFFFFLCVVIFFLQISS